MMVHATPSSLHAALFRELSPPSLSRRFKKDLLRSQVDCLLLGHTHTPMAARYKGVRIFNPGSVCHGRPRDSHTCAILTLPTFDFQVYCLHTQKPTDDVLRFEG